MLVPQICTLLGVFGRMNLSQGFRLVGVGGFGVGHLGSELAFPTAAG